MPRDQLLHPSKATHISPDSPIPPKRLTTSPLNKVNSYITKNSITLKKHKNNFNSQKNKVTENTTVFCPNSPPTSASDDSGLGEISSTVKPQNHLTSKGKQKSHKQLISATTLVTTLPAKPISAKRQPVNSQVAKLPQTSSDNSSKTSQELETTRLTERTILKKQNQKQKPSPVRLISNGNTLSKPNCIVPPPPDNTKLWPETLAKGGSVKLKSADSNGPRQLLRRRSSSRSSLRKPSLSNKQSQKNTTNSGNSTRRSPKTNETEINKSNNYKPNKTLQSDSIKYSKNRVATKLIQPTNKTKNSLTRQCSDKFHPDSPPLLRGISSMPIISHPSQIKNLLQSEFFFTPSGPLSPNSLFEGSDNSCTIEPFRVSQTQDLLQLEQPTLIQFNSTEEKKFSNLLSGECSNNSIHTVNSFPDSKTGNTVFDSQILQPVYASQAVTSFPLTKKSASPNRSSRTSSRIPKYNRAHQQQINRSFGKASTEVNQQSLRKYNSRRQSLRDEATVTSFFSTNNEYNTNLTKEEITSNQLQKIPIIVIKEKGLRNRNITNNCSSSSNYVENHNLEHCLEKIRYRRNYLEDIHRNQETTGCCRILKTNCDRKSLVLQDSETAQNLDNKIPERPISVVSPFDNPDSNNLTATSNLVRLRLNQKTEKINNIGQYNTSSSDKTTEIKISQFSMDNQQSIASIPADNGAIFKDSCIEPSVKNRFYHDKSNETNWEHSIYDQSDSMDYSDQQDESRLGTHKNSTPYHPSVDCNPMSAFTYKTFVPPKNNTPKPVLSRWKDNNETIIKPIRYTTENQKPSHDTAAAQYSGVESNKNDEYAACAGAVSLGPSNFEAETNSKVSMPIREMSTNTSCECTQIDRLKNGGRTNDDREDQQHSSYIDKEDNCYELELSSPFCVEIEFSTHFKRESEESSSYFTLNSPLPRPLTKTICEINQYIDGAESPMNNIASFDIFPITKQTTDAETGLLETAPICMSNDNKTISISSISSSIGYANRSSKCYNSSFPGNTENYTCTELNIGHNLHQTKSEHTFNITEKPERQSRAVRRDVDLSKNFFERRHPGQGEECNSQTCNKNTNYSAVSSVSPHRYVSVALQRATDRSVPESNLDKTTPYAMDTLNGSKLYKTKARPSIVEEYDLRMVRRSLATVDLLRPIFVSPQRSQVTNAKVSPENPSEIQKIYDLKKTDNVDLQNVGCSKENNFVIPPQPAVSHHRDNRGRVPTLVFAEAEIKHGANETSPNISEYQSFGQESNCVQTETNIQYIPEVPKIALNHLNPVLRNLNTCEPSSMAENVSDMSDVRQVGSTVNYSYCSNITKLPSDVEQRRFAKGIKKLQNDKRNINPIISGCDAVSRNTEVTEKLLDPARKVTITSDQIIQPKLAPTGDDMTNYWQHMSSTDSESELYRASHSTENKSRSDWSSEKNMAKSIQTTTESNKSKISNNDETKLLPQHYQQHYTRSNSEMKHATINSHMASNYARIVTGCTYGAGTKSGTSTNTIDRNLALSTAPRRHSRTESYRPDFTTPMGFHPHKQLQEKDQPGIQKTSYPLKPALYETALSRLTFCDKCEHNIQRFGLAHGNAEESCQIHQFSCESQQTHNKHSLTDQMNKRNNNSNMPTNFCSNDARRIPAITGTKERHGELLRLESYRDESEQTPIVIPTCKATEDNKNLYRTGDSHFIYHSDSLPVSFVKTRVFQYSSLAGDPAYIRSRPKVIATSKADYYNNNNNNLNTVPIMEHYQISPADNITKSQNTFQPKLDKNVISEDEYCYNTFARDMANSRSKVITEATGMVPTITEEKLKLIRNVSEHSNASSFTSMTETHAIVSDEDLSRNMLRNLTAVSSSGEVIQKSCTILALKKDTSHSPIQKPVTSQAINEISNHEVFSKLPVPILLHKGVTGLGISLEGGKESPAGDRPLVIKKVFHGGAADKSGRLKPGDRIIGVNGINFTGLTHLEAWNRLKSVPDGDVILTIQPLIQ